MHCLNIDAKALLEAAWRSTGAAMRAAAAAPATPATPEDDTFDKANPSEEFRGAADATGTLDDEAAAVSGEGAAVLEAEDEAAGAAGSSDAQVTSINIGRRIVVRRSDRTSLEL